MEINKVQNYIFFGSCYGLFSPFISIHHQRLLLNDLKITPESMLRLTRIMPQQMALKSIQMAISTPIKEKTNTWVGFGVIGVLQGVIYGHANISIRNQFIKEQKRKLHLLGMFRGSMFAASRDMISQGIPYVYHKKVGYYLLGENKERQLFSLLFTTTGAAVMSQFFHNCQCNMHVDASLNYEQAVEKTFRQHGLRSFYVGVSNRMFMLYFMNILNEVFLRPVWN